MSRFRIMGGAIAAVLVASAICLLLSGCLTITPRLPMTPYGVDITLSPPPVPPEPIVIGK